MKSQDGICDRINSCIQRRLLDNKNGHGVDPVTATKWLIQEDIREKMDSRPGSYLRSLCRSGKILGAERDGKKWIIKRVAC